jgi:hypothetical protein
MKVEVDMAEPMVSAQTLLNPQQHRRLEAIARCEGKSISTVTHQVIDLGLQCMKNEAAVWKIRNLVFDWVQPVS